MQIFKTSPIGFYGKTPQKAVTKAAEKAEAKVAEKIKNPMDQFIKENKDLHEYKRHFMGEEKLVAQETPVDFFSPRAIVANSSMEKTEAEKMASEIAKEVK